MMPENETLCWNIKKLLSDGKPRSVSEIKRELNLQNGRARFWLEDMSGKGEIKRVESYRKVLYTKP